MATVAQLLSGTITERPNYAIHLMTEAEAREYLTRFDKEMPKSRRGKVIRSIAESPVARLSPEARDLYRAYAAAYGA